MRRYLFLAVALVVAPAALLVLTLAAAAARPATDRRRRRRERPRLVYGPNPIIAIRNMREALAAAGYDATTVVYDVMQLHSQRDFDRHLADFVPLRGSTALPVRAVRFLVGPYVVFVRLLFAADVFHFFFDGGFLAPTPLRFLEVQLLRLAGKRVVVMPYGSDVAVPSLIRSLEWRNGLLVHYPHLARESRVRRQIRYFSKRADFVVGCIFHAETMPRWDLLTTHYYPIDTDAWNPQLASAGERAVVTVVHAPNHRALKGTRFLVQACRELEAEGYAVELRLLEGIPNTEVKRVMAEADVVAEQFFQGYGLTAIEGMSLGKPVLSNLEDDSYYGIFRLETGLDECPIVSTPAELIKENLKRLVDDAELRRDLGAAGRRYVLKYHSYEPVARMWELVYRRVWFGEDLDVHAWHPGAEGSAQQEPAPAATR